MSTKKVLKFCNFKIQNEIGLTKFFNCEFCSKVLLKNILWYIWGVLFGEVFWKFNQFMKFFVLSHEPSTLHGQVACDIWWFSASLEVLQAIFIHNLEKFPFERVLLVDFGLYNWNLSQNCDFLFEIASKRTLSPLKWTSDWSFTSLINPEKFKFL